MSGALLKVVHQVRGLYPSERSVLFSFAFDVLPNATNRSQLTATEIRQQTGLSTRAIRRAISVLAGLGHITREPTNGGPHFTLVHPDPSIVGGYLPSEEKRKRKISAKLSRVVMERDAYRCVVCGTHLNLGCDHIIPESRGGPTTLHNLQTMCGTCNSAKGDRLA